MLLREITIAGFKSFATTVHLELEPGLTGVIGPNGSGKSNVAEAIRWVLGEQAIKQLRGEQAADVIFAGNAQRRQSGRASVTLTFDNSAGRLGVDTPEVTIAREVTRDGESEYRVNGEVVRLLDLQQLLAEAGFGVRSYTVISQGMVDHYLTATAAGRRELFDEACGIKPLQLKVQRARRKLVRTAESAAELTTIIEELEPRVRVLARDYKRQQEQATLVTTVAEKQAAWFAVAWDERRQAVKTAPGGITAGANPTGGSTA